MAFWIVWFIVGITFVLLFTGMVLPRIMLKTHAATLPVRDKAVERLSDEHGAIFVYVPSASARRYIKSYRIARDERGLFFRGEWDHPIAFADYELTVYNAENDVIEILRVKEKFNGRKTTHKTRLPKKADYVTLRVVCVDDDPIPAERRGFGGRYAAWLAVLSFCVAFAADLLLWLVTLFVIRCFDHFSMTIELPIDVWASMLGYTALAAALITVAISLGKFFLFRRKGDAYES